VLPQARRIRRTNEFGAVLRARHRGACPTLVVHVGLLDAATASDPGAPPGPARVGFVVSRAVGGSVQRHRVSRRLRHLMAAQLPDVPDGLGVVVRALPPAAVADPATLASALETSLGRALRSLGHVGGTTSVGAP
jgi:ribonuclease P protein component